MMIQLSKVFCFLTIVLGVYLMQSRVEVAEAETVSVAFAGIDQNISSSQKEPSVIREVAVDKPQYLAGGGRVAKFEQMIKELLKWMKARRIPHNMDDDDVHTLAQLCDDVFPPGHDIQLPTTQGAGGSRRANTTPEGRVRADAPHGNTGASWHPYVHVHINNATGDTVCFIDEWGRPRTRPGGGGQ